MFAQNSGSKNDLLNETSNVNSETSKTGDSQTSRRQLSVASRLVLMGTSVLFWVVGSTLPDSESVLKNFAKAVAVLSFLNYATWTGKRHIVGILDVTVVHLSIAVFLLKLWGRSPVFAVNVVGLIVTMIAFRRKRKAYQQIYVHLIALLNLYIFGVLATRALKH